MLENLLRFFLLQTQKKKKKMKKNEEKHREKKYKLFLYSYFSLFCLLLGITSLIPLLMISHPPCVSLFFFLLFLPTTLTLLTQHSTSNHPLNSQFLFCCYFSPHVSTQAYTCHLFFFHPPPPPHSAFSFTVLVIVCKFVGMKIIVITFVGCSLHTTTYYYIYFHFHRHHFHSAFFF